jgi:mannose-6-phosphate isomerase-like protein (cupin superfamily)
MQIVRSQDLDFTAASHEDPNRPGVFKRVLATHSDFISGHVQMLNWARLPAGSSFRSHFHEDMQEAFLILSGHVRIEIEDESEELFSGDLVFIPPRAVHRMTNVGQADADYIVIGVSSGEGGRTVVVEDAESSSPDRGCE